MHIPVRPTENDGWVKGEQQKKERILIAAQSQTLDAACTSITRLHIIFTESRKITLVKKIIVGLATVRSSRRARPHPSRYYHKRA